MAGTDADWYASAVLSTVERAGIDDEEGDAERLDTAADIFLDELAARHDTALFDRRRQLTEFYQRFHTRWRDAFEMVELSF